MTISAKETGNIHGKMTLKIISILETVRQVRYNIVVRSAVRRMQCVHSNALME